ncbi:MAG TPA: S9 family peptidase, partial [Gemmatimonadales bacterium]
RRAVTVDDYFAIKRVADPRVSPDGRWVAYTVSTSVLADDKSESRIWMAPVAGGDPIPLTMKGASASSPRWSPDGIWLGFLAARSGGETQVWLLNRLGGEAEQLTEVKQGVEGFTWSPDGARLALMVKDPTPEQAGDSSWIGHKAKTPRPWVVDRLQFKRDYTGYLSRLRTHLYRFELKSRKLTQLTSGEWDDGSPAWSPDGRFIAFSSNRDSVDGSYNSDIWVIAADDTTRGATTRRLTTDPGQDGSPAWSPDGQWIAYTRQPSGQPLSLIYDPDHLALIPAGGGMPRALTASLDRGVGSPRWAPDGQSVYTLLETSGEQHLIRVPLNGGNPVPVIAGARVVSSYDLAPDGTVLALVSEPTLPNEVFAATGTGLRQLSFTNRELLGQLELVDPEELTARSRDGAAVEYFLYRPRGGDAGRPPPALLRIHGGPVSQYDKSFTFDAQLFAARGYAVVMANPRGSSGYGARFARAIFADWGNKDFDDILAAVDHAVARGTADPERLGVGGWSYGGILTNYVITKSTRFKAAISGASEALYTANYGHDHYQYLWEIELGLPWRNQKAWDRISPFWSVEKIVTPTLWIGGEKDWNVPIINSEQMYQAMRRLGRTTELVVYPGQFHGISKPSYVKDRYQRYLAWYDRFLQESAVTGPGSREKP